MRSTARILQLTAHLISHRGLHTGNQFASKTGSLDICAAVFMAAERYALPGQLNVPTEFTTDEDASIRLIECSAGAMQGIRAISAVLDSAPCETEIAPGVTVPDYIEHVSNWAATNPIGQRTPPTVSEVIGRVLRAAIPQDPNTTHVAA